MTNTATRLITLIMLLQSQPNQKAADLAKKLNVSVRSLHRYIGMLDEMGIPVYSERGPYGGFSLVRGYKMPPLALTPEEAVAVALGASLVGEMWGQFYQEAAQGALAKLDRLLPDEQRAEIAWARRTLFATGMHRADLEALAPVLEKLRRSVRELRRVGMTYHTSSRPAPETRQVDPYALVHRWGWWYLVGYCHLRQEVRSFRVDRIQELSLLSQVFQPPEDFNIQEYLARDWQTAPQVQVKLRFEPQAAHVAHTNRFYWDSLEEQEDGGVLVAYASPDLGWAASSILAYGPIVTVIEPQELGEFVRQAAEAIARIYNRQP